jgi:hypothetical protein
MSDLPVPRELRTESKHGYLEKHSTNQPEEPRTTCETIQVTPKDQLLHFRMPCALMDDATKEKEERSRGGKSLRQRRPMAEDMDLILSAWVLGPFSASADIMKLDELWINVLPAAA